ncbi:hypothetical protein, partial [Roseibium sp. RKSG952]|uniref:hypothetical protein n=1 Tax=Roseibium sp. RKSG952 TaxID=2529384 RepID=UPI0013CBE5C9
MPHRTAWIPSGGRVALAGKVLQTMPEAINHGGSPVVGVEGFPLAGEEFSPAQAMEIHAGSINRDDVRMLLQIPGARLISPGPGPGPGPG